MDVSEAKANIESVRKEASKPVAMTGNASGMVSAARSAYWQIEDIGAQTGRICTDESD